MTRFDIEKELGKVPAMLARWHAADDVPKNAFCHQMRFRNYGYEALSSAWLWFLAGWDGSTP